ncbi:hypothetical protein HaLaN_07574 [Haematococcus lacustris]|uniref:Uncharacterized protein n=1 Tax=Haematococcus lacustris TaxID=44745 RepID=A0A699YZC1_HAELA|nr:hypothetical protein HaLaN_07574 [Haematococcus lacustris]
MSLASCEIAVVKATDSVPNAHFSSAFCWLSPPLAPPLTQQGLVTQLGGAWAWADCTAADVQRG